MKKTAGGFAAPGAQEAARQALARAVPAGSPEDAWGQLVAVQAEIAMEAENGSKATAAARLVAEATGMLPGGAPSSPLLEFSLSLSAEDARKLSAAVKAEQRKRKKR